MLLCCVVGAGQREAHGDSSLHRSSRACKGRVASVTSRVLKGRKELVFLVKNGILVQNRET